MVISFVISSIFTINPTSPFLKPVDWVLHTSIKSPTTNIQIASPFLEQIFKTSLVTSPLLL